MASFHLSVKSGKKGKASDHAAYIARTKKYKQNGKGEDLLALEHGNLPVWANDDPSVFWKMADKFERANGAAYREFEMALPREFSLEQNLVLVRDFIRQEVGNKPYQFAIHSPQAALGDGAQPQAIIMVSDRIPDQVARPPEQHFGRFNAKSPELGGCRKDSGGRKPAVLREELISRRERFANLQNRHLAQHGYSASVDHRSNRERGLVAVPERHLGHAVISKMSAENIQMHKANRLGNNSTKHE